MTDEQRDAITAAFHEWVDQVGLDPLRYTLEIGKLDSIFEGGLNYPITVSFGETHGMVRLDPGLLKTEPFDELAATLVHQMMSSLLAGVVGCHDPQV